MATSGLHVFCAPPFFLKKFFSSLGPPFAMERDGWHLMGIAYGRNEMKRYRQNRHHVHCSFPMMHERVYARGMYHTWRTGRNFFFFICHLMIWSYHNIVLGDTSSLASVACILGKERWRSRRVLVGLASLEVYHPGLSHVSFGDHLFFLLFFLFPWIQEDHHWFMLCSWRYLVHSLDNIGLQGAFKVEVSHDRAECVMYPDFKPILDADPVFCNNTGTSVCTGPPLYATQYLSAVSLFHRSLCNSLQGQRG